MVSDVVGAAPSNQGTDTAVPICALECALATDPALANRTVNDPHTDGEPRLRKYVFAC
jgi:hypothetical protein